MIGTLIFLRTKLLVITIHSRIINNIITTEKMVKIKCADFVKINYLQGHYVSF